MESQPERIIPKCKTMQETHFLFCFDWAFIEKMGRSKKKFFFLVAGVLSITDSDINLDDDSDFVFSNVSSDSCYSENVGCEEIE